MEQDWITSLSDSIERGLNKLCSTRIKSFLVLDAVRSGLLFTGLELHSAS